MQAASSHSKDTLDLIEQITKLVGIAVAAVWAYFNFVKSRTYYPRMEMTASGEIRESGSQKYVVPRITLKNIGNSKIALINRGSGYRIWISTEGPEQSGEMLWMDGKPVYSMFEQHHWIEPGESIFDETRLIRLPASCVAVKIEVDWSPRCADFLLETMNGIARR